MFYEVYIDRYGESYFFHSYDNALDYAEGQLRRISNWTTDEIEEAVTRLEEDGYVENTIYLTERMFED